MKTFVKALMVLAMIGIIGFAFAQEKKGEGKGKKANPTAAMMKKLDTLELTAEQKEKVAAINKEYEPKLKEANDKVNASLTDEQRKARDEAQKAAKAAGKKGKEAAADAEAAMKLTDEQKKKYDEAQKNQRDVTAAYNKAIAGVLSQEQIDKIGLKTGGKKKNQ